MRKNERDTSLKHSLAELALVRSQQAETAFERERFRDECRTQATALLNDEGAGRYARHTLAKVLIAELSDVLDGETHVEVLIFDRQGGLVGRADG